MSDRGGQPALPGVARRGFFAGWRGLRRFWLLIAFLTATGAGVLQLLGPPPHPTTDAAGGHGNGGAPSAEAAARSTPSDARPSQTGNQLGPATPRAGEDGRAAATAPSPASAGTARTDPAAN